MAGAFDAKVDISTKEATDGLKALRKEVTGTSTDLTALDKIIKSSSGGIKDIAAQFTQLVATQRAAAAAAKDLANAQIAEARAMGIVNTAAAKQEELQARTANQTAQKTRAEAQGALAVARTAESETRRGLATDRASQATQRATAAQLAMNDGLSNSRYLMYDVGATYGVLSTGLMAIPAATAAVAAAYQRDFAQVLRVTEDLDKTQGGAQGLKDSLKAMTTDMPIAFDELSRITQLGAQMGVANDKLVAFTETTAKFVAVTGISADTGATLFGRMEASFSDDVAKYPDYFERLGSSIARVGADTVATDPEISSMLSQIGPLGAAAGMTSANITGLAAAMASVRIQPELARGTLTRVFGQLNRDIAEGSPRMAEYGKLMGITSEQASKLWKTDSSQFFTRTIEGLQKVQNQNGELTTTFDKLGIKASRDVSALTKLAVGYDVLDLSMKSANKGFSEGTALNEMSKVTFETVIAKLTEMGNAWKGLADTLGSGSLGGLAVLIDMAKNLATGIDGLVKHVPAIGVLISALMGFAAITALFLGFKAAQAFVTAGFIGFQQAAARGVGAGLSLSGTLRQLAVTMLMAKGMTNEMSTSLVQANGAMAGYRLGLQRLTVSTETGVSGFARLKGGVASVSSSLLGMVGGPIGLAVTGLALLAGHLISTQVEAEQAGKSIAEAMQQGAASGARAVAEAFNNRKVSFTDNELGFTDQGKTLTQIAERAGVSFNKIVDAVAKGETGMRDFRAELQKVATEQGFKTIEDFLSTAAPGNKAADIKFISNAVDEAAKSSKEQAKGLQAVEAAAPGAAKAVADVGDGSEETASKIDEMTKALKDLNDEIFGTINAESNLQDAMSKLGEGLQASSQFTPNSEDGRANLKNLEESLTKAREYYTQLKDSDQLSAQEAAQGYADFVQALMDQIHALGGDTSAVDELANNTKARFSAIIGGGVPTAIPVDANTEPAVATVNAAAQELAATPLAATLTIGMDKSNADANMMLLAQNISKITGIPYQVVMDALTDPASEKAGQIESLLVSIADGTYVAAVDADTTAAVANVQNFLAFARTELSHLQTQLNGGVGLADGEGSMSPAQKAQYTAIGPAQVRAARPANGAAALAAIPTRQNSFTPAMNGVQQGYDKATQAAQKTGEAGKKAGKDMADGLKDAAAAADDYGNRLKTALTSAFDKQYGLTKATDDYHSALNAITKKREDELKQLDDLRDKVKALNDEREKELITANKAKIEQNISLKYGEVDRAADYGSQARTALDNASAKAKDIDATNKQSRELSDGIGKLTGYSDAAIANREALRGLESKMIDMISAYAATGASVDQVRAYAQRLTGQFQVDVGQMGLNQGAVGALQGSMERYIGVINTVPLVKPTTVTADTGAATGAVQGFGAAADAATVPRIAPITVVAETSTFEEHIKQVMARVRESLRLSLLDPVGTGSAETGGGRANGSMRGGMYRGGQVAGFAGGGLVPGRSPSDPTVDNLMAQVDGKGMIKVRSREFIQPEPAVDYYGLDAMNAIRTMQMPKFNMGGSVSSGRGSSGGAGSSVVALDADTLSFLASLKQEVKLYADSRELASSVNAGNRQLAAEGRN